MKPKLIVLAIDGADFDLMDKAISAGMLPNFGHLREHGASGVLNSPLPVTPPGWTSIFTGVNPGKHGIFHFHKQVLADQPQSPLLQNERLAPAVWSLLSENSDAVSAIWRVPWTYPVDRINGYMVAELAPIPAKQPVTWPTELQAEIAEKFPWYDTWLGLRLDHPSDSSHDIGDTARDVMHDEFRLNEYLMDNSPADFVVVTIDTVDHLIHRVLRTYSEWERAEEIMVSAYKEIDLWLPSLIDRLTEDGVLLIVSDHGSGYKDTEVNMTQLLHRSGLLHVAGQGKARQTLLRTYRALGPAGPPIYRAYSRLKRIPRPSTDATDIESGGASLDWGSTKVVSYGSYGLLRFNIRGRDPHGIVPEGSTSSLLKELRDKLLCFRDDRGRPVFQDVLATDETFPGPQLPWRPDAFAILHDDCYISDYGPGRGTGLPLAMGGVQQGMSPVSSQPSGNHGRRGIVFCYGRGIEEGSQLHKASVEDVAPTLLYLLGMKIPLHMDGRLLNEAISPSLLQQKSPEYAPACLREASTETSESELEDTTELEERLRGLGYL